MNNPNDFETENSILRKNYGKSAQAAGAANVLALLQKYRADRLADFGTTNDAAPEG